MGITFSNVGAGTEQGIISPDNNSQLENTGIGKDDSLFGGAGNDTLQGGKGNDFLYLECFERTPVKPT